MHTTCNLRLKQQRFIEEYQVNGNGRQLVLLAGYQTKYQAEMAYGLLRNTKIKDTPQDVQNSRRERLQIRVRTVH